MSVKTEKALREALVQLSCSQDAHLNNERFGCIVCRQHCYIKEGGAIMLSCFHCVHVLCALDLALPKACQKCNCFIGDEIVKIQQSVALDDLKLDPYTWYWLADLRLISRRTQENNPYFNLTAMMNAKHNLPEDFPHRRALLAAQNEFDFAFIIQDIAFQDVLLNAMRGTSFAKLDALLLE